MGTRDTNRRDRQLLDQKGTVLVPLRETPEVHCGSQNYWHVGDSQKYPRSWTWKSNSKRLRQSLANCSPCDERYA
jgi:hypothetical protein